MAYIYAADLHCDKCGEEIQRRLIDEGKAPEDVSDERTFDSDDYPKYVGTDGGESDCPQHCGSCHEPLDNPLTDDGVKYVLDHIHEAIEEAVEKGRATTWDRIMPMPVTAEEDATWLQGKRHVEIVRHWAEQIRYYNLERDEIAIVNLFIELSEPVNQQQTNV